MSQRFAVVREAEADLEIATKLADRVLVETIAWLEEPLLVGLRTWVAKTPEGVGLTWKAIPKLAKARGIRAHGHFEGEPGAPDAAAARRAILCLEATFPDLDALLLIRDLDDQPDRRTGLEQARRTARDGDRIVIGLAVVERECWVINGFDPLDVHEEERLEAERKRLGFDPRERSHGLSACKNDHADRSPKRVLRELCGSRRDRERVCWEDTDLGVLSARGQENGLQAFLEEVRTRLAPLIAHISWSPPPGSSRPTPESGSAV